MMPTKISASYLFARRVYSNPSSGKKGGWRRERWWLTRWVVGGKKVGG